ncbi:MAG: glycoside hydrolase family 16 protein [Trebonia sp.]
MVVRNKHTPHDARPKRPTSRNARTALYVGGAVVAGAAVVIGVHVATSSSGGGVSVARPAAVHDAGPPKAGGAHAGTLKLNVTGQQLASWNATSTFCPGNSWQVPDGTVGYDPGGDVTLLTTGKPGSCVALVSKETVSSGVVEADIDFPAVPGKPGTIANWTSVWLTNQDDWPVDGELDAVEAEPATGKNAVAYHWGASSQSVQEVSTDGFAQDGNLPVKGPNLTPGWHVVDVVYTKGSFAVYYDGKLFSSGTDSAITGAPVNLIISSSVTPDTAAVEQTIGGTAPVNSDSSPATIAVKYVKVWSYK